MSEVLNELNPQEGEKYTGSVEYEFIGDDGEEAVGHISYEAEVVAHDGDTDAGGQGGFYGLKVIPDSLEADIDELSAASLNAKMNDEFANFMIKPGGDYHEDALEVAQEDADEQFAQADIDVPLETISLEDIDLDEDLGAEFEYDRNLPVADNFDNFVSMHNDEMAQLRKAYGGYFDKDYKNKEEFEEMRPLYGEFYKRHRNIINNEKFSDEEFAKRYQADPENNPAPMTDSQGVAFDYAEEMGYLSSAKLKSKDNPQVKQAMGMESVEEIKKLAGITEGCNVCDAGEEESADSESVHFRKEKSSEHGSVSIEASADTMDEMKRLLSLIGHDLPKEMSPQDHGDGGEDGGDDKPKVVMISKGGDKPFDPYGNNKKALLNYLQSKYQSL